MSDSRWPHESIPFGGPQDPLLMEKQLCLRLSIFFFLYGRQSRNISASSSVHRMRKSQVLVRRWVTYAERRVPAHISSRGGAADAYEYEVARAKKKKKSGFPP